MDSFYADDRLTPRLLTLRNAVQTALLVTYAALRNPHSLGRHYRDDSLDRPTGDRMGPPPAAPVDQLQRIVGERRPGLCRALRGQDADLLLGEVAEPPTASPFRQRQTQCDLHMSAACSHTPACTI